MKLPKTIPFKEETFHKVLELTKLNKNISDSDLLLLIQTEINVSPEIAEKYLESLHNFFACDIF